MKKITLLVAAGLMLLATACTENTVTPANAGQSNSTTQAAPNPAGNEQVNTGPGSDPAKVQPVQPSVTPEKVVTPKTGGEI